MFPSNGLHTQAQEGGKIRISRSNIMHINRINFRKVIELYKLQSTHGLIVINDFGKSSFFGYLGDKDTYVCT
mgnify:CR=1 FL=1